MAQAQNCQSLLQGLRTKRTASERRKENESSEKPALRFRNYNPSTDGLREKKLLRTKPESVEQQVSEQLQAGSDPDIQDVSLANLAPKKPDWDLKRDLAPKLERLERRTQRAIVDLIRERVQDGGQELAAAVASVKIPPDQQDYSD